MFHAVIPCITSPVLLICQVGMARMHDILTIRTEFIPRITAAAPPMATKVGWDHPDYELLARAYLQLMRATNDAELHAAAALQDTRRLWWREATL